MHWATTGCGSTTPPEPPEVRAIWELPRATADVDADLDPEDTPQHFFDLPWPTDVRRTAAGTIDMSGLWPGHCLAVHPLFGAPLEWATTYSVVAGSGEDLVPELVAAVATVVAHTLWSVALGGAPMESRGVFVDKEADDLFRVDLRSVPAVRARMASTGSVAAMVEALALGNMRADDGMLSLTLELPSLQR